MKLIKLNDNLGTIINLKQVETIWTQYIEGSNPYYTINISFISGKTEHLRYEVINKDIYEGDRDYILGFTDRR